MSPPRSALVAGCGSSRRRAALAAGHETSSLRRLPLASSAMERLNLYGGIAVALPHTALIASLPTPICASYLTCLFSSKKKKTRGGPVLRATPRPRFRCPCSRAVQAAAASLRPGRKLLIMSSGAAGGSNSSSSQGVQDRD
jgi:hypothetical protein